MTHALLLIFAATLVALLLGAGVLHALAKAGLGGLSRWLCRAPGLDLVILYFTVLPMVGGPIAGVQMHARLAEPGMPGWAAGWLGLVAAVLGQIGTVMIWTVLHEVANRKHLRGPRIVHQLNRTVGRTRNHAAVWWTAWAVPLFAIVRAAEYFIYPPLIYLVRFPRYKQGEWVNVSRHKFSGLVGHDLIWCLYCDWMTGVWSLGTEMLRNVESFWCPIRFDSTKKCENCRVDFPDIEGGWVPADGSMQDVVHTLDTHYGKTGVNAWYGHPARLTVEGREAEK
ncbi:MAG: hypothetical protein KJZ65_02330 [Phycisphaerales bacterium]|nr:hypothetical protein [Phycisphaerales bacterium]